MLIHGAVDNDIHPPRFGGTQRLFGLYRGLARRADVAVLCMVPNRTRAPREETVAGVRLLRRKAWYTSAAWRLEQFGIAPLFAAERGHRANAAQLLAAPGGSPDVFAADLHLAGLLAPSRAPLKLYTSQNVEYDLFRRTAPRLAFRDRWAERLRALEASAVAGADLTVTCSDEDAARMRELYGATPDRLTVIPNGWDETTLAPPRPEARARARALLGVGEGDYLVAFVGSDFAPNRAALTFLLERVMPALAGESIRLLVVGSIARRVEGRREPWLIALGETDDLTAALAPVDAGLNPVTVGSGSNVKVPTYLACGLAVITTPFGLRGYAPLADGVVCAEADAFADALRARPRGWSASGAPAPPALADFAWGRLGERLAGELARRLAAAPPRRAQGAA